MIVDKLTETAHFLPIKNTYSTDRLARLYVNRIVCLHRVPVSIVSDRGTTFTSVFWQELHKALGTRLDFSTAFHPQTDGQSERTIQTLEDMFRSITKAPLTLLILPVKFLKSFILKIGVKNSLNQKPSL